MNAKNPPQGRSYSFFQRTLNLLVLLVWAILGSLFLWINSHHLRLSLPPASRISLKALAGLRESSSCPLAMGVWFKHHRVSRISVNGSASGSQPGQYDLAIFGESKTESDIEISPICSWFKLKKTRLCVNISNLLKISKGIKNPAHCGIFD